MNVELILHTTKRLNVDKGSFDHLIAHSIFFGQFITLLLAVNESLIDGHFQALSARIQSPG